MGIGYATILHNEGWWFSQAGKFIERADKTSRILDVRYASLPERGVPEASARARRSAWSAILRSCSAWDAYKSLRGAEVHPRFVAEFLLFNEDFPRSARFCVGELNTRACATFPASAAGAFATRRKNCADAWRPRCNSARWRKSSSRGLHGTSDQFQDKLNSIGGAVFDAYIFQYFNNEGEEMMIQQEEQQQQTGRNR